MNKMKNYLLLAAVLFAGSVSAAQINLQEPESAAACEQEQLITREAREFKKLVNEALSTKVPSGANKALMGIVKTLVKILGTVGVFFGDDYIPGLGDKLLPNFKLSSQENQMYLMFALFTIIPLLSEVLIYKKDQSLASLNKLQNYVANLKPEQKGEIISLFKEKYANLLSKKVMQEKESKVGKGVMAAIDVLLPLAWIIVLAVCLMDKSSMNESFGMIAILGVFPVAPELLVVAYNNWFSNDKQKADALKAIQAALK